MSASEEREKYLALPLLMGLRSKSSCHLRVGDLVLSLYGRRSTYDYGEDDLYELINYLLFVVVHTDSDGYYTHCLFSQGHIASRLTQHITAFLSQELCEKLSTASVDLTDICAYDDIVIQRLNS